MIYINILKQFSHDLEDNDELIIFSALITTKGRQYTIIVNIFSNQPYTLRKECHIITFSILTTEQAKGIKRVNVAPLLHLLDINNDDATLYVNALRKMLKSEKSIETYWLLLLRNRVL